MSLNVKNSEDLRMTATLILGSKNSLINSEKKGKIDNPPTEMT
jgi:hypothetical protein